MRKFFALLAVVLLASTALTAFARVDTPTVYEATRALMPGDLNNDAPQSQLAPTLRDTIDFGFYEIRLDGLKYAVLGGKWTFDHGAADPLEGWTATDLTANDKDYWRHMTQAIWNAEGNGGQWPAMNASVGIALCGATKGHADSLGWEAGVGYGNNWCQRLTSPTLVYDGSGSVDLSFNYFNQTEPEYDYSKVFVNSGAVSTLLNPPGFDGFVGIDTLGVITQVSYARSILNAELGGGTTQRNFTIVLEFKSDGGLSDEDGTSGWDDFYGPWGVDNVLVQNNLVPNTPMSYNFDNGLQGWTASKCPGIGSFMGIAPRSNYVLQDPCACELSGNILKFHNANNEHPVFQHVMAYSPIADRKTDIGNPQYLSYNRIMMDWDQYSELPQENGVFYRSGWSYYPYENPNIPGLIQWSPRVGINTFYYTGADPVCVGDRNIGTDWGLPTTVEKVKAVYEVYSCCECFGIPPEICTDITNFTPIIDNIRIRNVGVPNAPSILFGTGMQLNDTYGADPTAQQGLLSTSDPGMADATYDLRFGTPGVPSRPGDSLVIQGPTPTTTTRWEAKMWFRLGRSGPGQSGNTLYNTWKNAFGGAPKNINFYTGTNPPFTWGYMDSVEAATVSKNKFCSQLRDGPSVGGGNLIADPDYNWGGGGEQAEGNEIIPDLALTPGTRLDYFITANYTCLPTTYYYLPDTTGKFYSELEILPSFRLDAGQPKFPCVLYIDGFNRGSQTYIENALNIVLNGAGSGDPIPDPNSWDRFDYFDASSNWKPSFYRDFGAFNGLTIPQLLGYRAVLFNSGTFDTGFGDTRDFQALQQWLEAVICDGNVNVQAVLLNGTAMSKIINQLYPRFLSQNLGAVHRCDSYNEQNCPPGETDNDENLCVRVDPVPGTPFGAGIPSDVYANWCPTKIAYGVVGVTGSGAGNKNFVKVGTGTLTQYAQVINDRIGAPEKYRTVLDNFSYHVLTERDLDVAPDPALECPNADTLRIVNASYREIQNALKWALNISNPTTLGLCGIPQNCGSSVPEENGGSALVNRLYQNHPNPFNPRTMIKFSLAANGPAELVIYDVNGRKVRTLVSGHQIAGPHEVIWDGTNDAGQPVASGVFWSQLTTDGFSSNKKMVVLK